MSRSKTNDAIRLGSIMIAILSVMLAITIYLSNPSNIINLLNFLIVLMTIISVLTAWIVIFTKKNIFR